jgi:hypothetical protein
MSTTAPLLIVKPILAESWLIPIAVLAVVAYRQLLITWTNYRSKVGVVSGASTPPITLDKIDERITDRSASTSDRRKEHRDEEDEGSRRNTDEEHLGRQYIRTFPDLATVSDVSSDDTKSRLRADKELYWKLQNLEDHPGELCAILRVST